MTNKKIYSEVRVQIDTIDTTDFVAIDLETVGGGG